MIAAELHVQQSTLTIRRLQDDEKLAFKVFAKRSLPHLMERITFSMSPDTFVAEKEGVWIGGLVLKMNTIGGKRWGEVAWVFTAPEARGMGVAQTLIDYALAFFEGQNVDGIYTFVEGDNASSFKLFTTRGFARTTFSDQWARFGINILTVWFSSAFAFAFGHFFYIRPAQLKTYRGKMHITAAVLFTTFCLMLGAWTWPVPFTTGMLYALAASILFVGGRTAAMLLAARFVGLQAHFRMTEPLTWLALLVAFSSGLVPIPGGVYPSHPNWQQREVRHKLGMIGFAGAAAVLLGLWLLIPLNEMEGVTRDFARVAQPFFMLGVFDIAVPFLKGYSASRIWNWNKAAWALMMVALVVWFTTVIAN